MSIPTPLDVRAALGADVEQHLPPVPDDAPTAARDEPTVGSLIAALDTAHRDLWRERALRRHPSIEPVVDLIPHSPDEATYRAFAAKLAAHMSRLVAA